MSAILKILKDLLPWSTVAIYAAVFAAGAVAGGYGAWEFMDGRVQAAKSDTKLARAGQQNAEHDLKECRAAAAMQNSAIDAMRQRAEQAEQARQAAEKGRTAAEAQANRILRERTPAGQDRCVAARNAFADELRQERGQ